MVIIRDHDRRDKAYHTLTKNHDVRNFRIFLEGPDDVKLLKPFLQEDGLMWWHVPCFGKKNVIREVTSALTNQEQMTSAIGIVDMDGHYADGRLRKALEKAAKKRPGVLEHLEIAIRDTSEDVCLMSTLDTMVDGDWVDVYSSDLKRKHGLRIEPSDWKAIFCVARYRSWFHAGSQTAEKNHPPELAPDLSALHSQRPELKLHHCAWVTEKSKITFSDWKDAVETTDEAQNSDQWGQWNDHVLTTTVFDFLTERFGVQSPSTKDEVEKGVLNAFRESIKQRKMRLDDLLTHLGFDIGSVLDAHLERKTQTSTRS